MVSLKLWKLLANLDVMNWSNEAISYKWLGGFEVGRWQAAIADPKTFHGGSVVGAWKKLLVLNIRGFVHRRNDIVQVQ